MHRGLNRRPPGGGRGPLCGRRRAARGVTLIELVIAVAVLALGTAAAWRSLDAARRGIGGQAGRVLAQEVALNRAAELRLARPGAWQPGPVAMGGIDWSVGATVLAVADGLAETEIVVTAPGQPSARLRVWLPAGAAGGVRP